MENNTKLANAVEKSRFVKALVEIYINLIKENIDKKGRATVFLEDVESRLKEIVKRENIQVESLKFNIRDFRPIFRSMGWRIKRVMDDVLCVSYTFTFIKK